MKRGHTLCVLLHLQTIFTNLNVEKNTRGVTGVYPLEKEIEIKNYTQVKDL